MNTNGKREMVMEWYDSYYDDIYRFILYMFGDRQLCEDFVHDTFVRAYTAMDRFDQRSSVKTWLFSIAKHVVLDEIRKRKRRKLVPIEKEFLSTFNVEQLIENKEAIQQLVNHIQLLKPNYRIVIILRKVEECSIKEIAEVLEWSETKVRKTLSRAVLLLRKMNQVDEGGGKGEQTR
ncbi:RNA polymerase sigma-70 factor (ECF subfamily) [Cytobacillus eiseniae]|uniref:RNA polymerase sigma-70 factor (ECF subfamily) n=1 Tax=Cytobacillus eiseniae TaxID=762947 RepID=A0ABS4RGB2_9BACI|nr:RNA polymerase sigma factor [Cytobacillus eiseniae]MBP2241936.1 RNA polymerase sigma-70 factor (ECF subfamily) [Cytobacillus eiseniae]